ncbi:MAG: V-type ATP synthase subunit B, partial [Methanoregulaceae archaeon]|nr:V-type ATP synthase subunit B [Methanoregulaceae archaeon]
VLPCLSRLMKGGIGPGRTREDHADVNNQLYAAYAQGIRLKGLVAVVGEEGLSETDRTYLRFCDRFETEFVGQGLTENRTFTTTLDIAWNLLSVLPEDELKRIDLRFIERYHPAHRNDSNE